MNYVEIKSGTRFGQLTVLEETSTDRLNRRFKCLCDCGKEKKFNESSFKCGGISSCCIPVVKNHVYYKRSLRTCIGMAISKRYKKTQRSAEMLGAPIDEVLKYIESIWQPNMSWKNKGKRGKDGWDIDHICPCSQAQNEEELIKLQHYTNLRPMWSIDNRIKNDFKTLEGEEMCRKLLNREWVDKPKWYNLSEK